MRQLIAACCVVLCLVGSVWAQPLADRVPEGSIVYVGWCGSTSLPAGYDGSHLRAVLDASKIKDLVNDFVPRLMRMVSQKEPDSREAMQMIQAIGTPMWKHPTAFFFAGAEFEVDRQFRPKFGWICQAGADGTNLAVQLNLLLNKLGPTPLPIRIVQVGDIVALVVGYEDNESPLAGEGADSPKPLGRSAAFQSALKQVAGNPLAIAYVDAEKLVALIDDAVLRARDAQPQVLWPRIRDAAGVGGLKRIICTKSFDGPDWSSQMFIEAPAPRSGVLSIIDNKPASRELLGVVPASATFVACGKLDLARLISEIRTAIGAVEPQAQVMFDRGLGAAQVALGKNLLTDVLDPLGEDWVMYAAPDVAGSGLLGTVIVNKLDDPARAKSALPTVSVNISNWLAVAMKDEDVKITGQMTKVGDLSIYYLGTPMVAPSWAMRDGYLYLGLYPEAVAAAARRAATGGKSILENEKFIALQKRLGVSEARGYTYFDLPTSAASGSSYQMLMYVSRLIGFADMFGVAAPAPLLPPLDVLHKHLSPAGSVTWVDDAGVHTRQISPFPGSLLLGEQSALAGIGGVGALGPLLPSVNRARLTAKQTACAANMRQIGVAIMVHAKKNQGDFPPDLGTLITTQPISVEVFVCPGGRTSPPPNFRTMPPQQLADWVNQHSDYVYLGKGLKNSTSGLADRIVVYERPGRYHPRGLNLLHGDGYVEAHPVYRALELIAEAEKQAADR